MPQLSAIAALHEQYRSGQTNPVEQCERALARANSNAGCNVYLAQSADWSRREAARLRPEDMHSQPLWGVPVSLKDCFDLAGFATSCGSSYFRSQHGLASKDSAVAARLRGAGAILMGKTHLHQLAYGITGENADFGDCAQPADPARLTGGSSSGAAASVQEGSAMAATGTDTGGSIRAPAALCGLVGYRSSITRQGSLWEGGHHLAPTFDTLGWLYRDPADGPLLARALFHLPAHSPTSLGGLRIGVPDVDFLHDCASPILQCVDHVCAQFAAGGAYAGSFNADWWNTAMSIFAPIQASEAAALHAADLQHFEPAIAERLRFGAQIDWETSADFHFQLAAFRARMSTLFTQFDYLLLPCTPMSSLATGADHSEARARILRYTTPISLAGLPVVTLPCASGGLQLVGRLGGDAELLALSATLQLCL